MMYGIKVPLKPTEEQKLKFQDHFDVSRWVFHNMLAWRKMIYKESPFTGEKIRLRVKVDAHSMMRRLNDLIKKNPWLRKAPRDVMNQAVMNLHRAFVNFFEGRANFPKFKKKSNHCQSAGYPCGVRVSDDYKRVWIPKIGWVKANVYRNIPDGAKIKTCTLKRASTAKYYMSLLIDDGLKYPKKLTEVDDVVGLDLGLTHLFITSEGEKVDNPKFLKKAQDNLRRKKRKYSRKKKGSKNQEKARIVVAKREAQVANKRETYQHQMIAATLKDVQAVGLETLQVKNMQKNRKLSKAIADASWGAFGTRIETRMQRTGGHLVKIDRFFPSSKTCYVCGEVLDKLPLSVRNWTCPCCRVKHDRDINAAINIRKEAASILKQKGVTVLEDEY